MLTSAAVTHQRVVCVQDEDVVADPAREGIFCILTISPPDPGTDDVDLDDEQIELQIYSEQGRIWVEISAK